MDGNDEPRSGRTDSDAATLRVRCRAARRGIDTTTRRAAESALAEQLLELTELSGPGQLALYLPTDGEVDLSGAADELRRRDWQLFLPVIGPERSMTFAPWSPESPMVGNRFGIAEPEHDDADLVTADALGVVIVPCVAVDRSGHRLGFGAGYYDRALATATATLRIGVAFETQVVERLRPEPWDVPLDVVVTETRVLRPER